MNFCHLFLISIVLIVKVSHKFAKTEISIFLSLKLKMFCFPQNKIYNTHGNRYKDIIFIIMPKLCLY